MSTVEQTPGATLRALRERVGMSQRELARQAGVAPNTIRGAELDDVVPLAVHQHAILRVLRLALGDRSETQLRDAWQRRRRERRAARA